MLADAVASIKSTVSADLQRVEHMHLATEGAVEHLWHKVIDQEHDLTRAVEQLVQVFAVLTERIESEQVERRALAEAIRSLAQQPVPSTSRPRLLGGSVFSTPAVPNGDQVVLIDDDPAPAEGVSADVNTEVWCRFEDRWVGGFEITEAVSDAGIARCRLRRRSDGYVLPTLFDVDDLRRAEDVTDSAALRPDRWHPAP